MQRKRTIGWRLPHLGLAPLTSKELWIAKLPASGHATPMTFKGITTGMQFVVIAAGGGNKYDKTFSDALVAFALP